VSGTPRAIHDLLAAGDRASEKVDKFLEGRSFPLVEGPHVTFVWRGDADALRTGMPVRTETIAVTMATPADGPSFGVAPSGTCTWMSRFSNSDAGMPK
jgi:hypothetical protein